MLKKFLIASTILFTPIVAYAQENNTIDDLQASKMTSIDKDYQDWVQNIAIPNLQSSCQKKGIELSNPSCTEESLIYGDGTVTVSQQDQNWADNRYLAYTEALLDAYKNVAEAIALNVETEIQHEFLQDTREPELKITKQTRIGALLDKLINLADTNIDKKLTELGVDVSKYKEAPESLKKDMFKDAITNNVIKKATSEISGMIPLQTFEGRNDMGDYIIRVVISTDPERISLLKSVLTKGETISPDISKAKKSLRERLVLDEAILFNQFGTKLMYDEEGYPVLVAFGQAGIKKGTSASQNSARLKAARIHALSRADGALTLLLNGSIETKNITSEIKQHLEQTVLAFDNEKQNTTKKETSSDTYDEMINETTQASGKISDFAGRRQFHTWTFEHPDTKQKVAGVILVWSPKTAKMSNDIKHERNQIEENNSETAKSSSTNIPSATIRGIESDF